MKACFHKHRPRGNRGTGHLEACLDSMHVLINHVTTPVFVAAQLFDQVVKNTVLNSFTFITNSFATRGYEADADSVCGSHDENFVCSNQQQCPDVVAACDPNLTLPAVYKKGDFAERVKAIAEGFTGKTHGIPPEESPLRSHAAVGHAAFIRESHCHDGWGEKTDTRICDNPTPPSCDLEALACVPSPWTSATVEQVLQAWLEENAVVICVEEDLPGQDLDRPLTAWSETTPGPVLDARCGLNQP